MIPVDQGLKDYAEPGPSNSDLLSLQSTRRSEQIWDYPEWDARLKVCHTEAKMFDARHRWILRHLITSCLYGVYTIGEIKVDIDLVRAFVIRWRSETHTFHLPFGEVTITLKDVDILTGLLIEGKAES